MYFQNHEEIIRNQLVLDYCSAELTSCAMKSSTAEPALTSIMTRLGFFNLDTISSIDLAPMTFVPGECGVCK